jgi:LDH2 family malate/lactate/ureidoglycolate dehydrogenase
VTQTQLIVDHQSLTEAVAGIYEHYRLPANDARLVAEGLVRADLRGVWSHGVARVSMYAERLRRGVLDPTPPIGLERLAPAVAHMDGANGIGFVVATRAIDTAIEIADELGVGAVGVRRSGHYGMAANYVLHAIERGFLSFIYTNASPAMPPFGGRVPMLGTNPYAVGIPGGGRDDVVIDMACTVTARGKLKFAAQRGEAIPEGYALDEQGRTTTDGAAAFGGEVRNPFTGLDGPQDVGHFFLAMKADLFVSQAEYRMRMETLTQRVRNCPRAEGFGEILLPGEPETRHETERRRNGIPYSASEIDALQQEAGRAGVPPLAIIA